jgi:hypothetical protein
MKVLYQADNDLRKAIVRASHSSFAFGGLNAVLAFRRAPVSW